MKKSYQISDASVKRYWKIRIANDEVRAIEIFEKWAKSEAFCKYTRWQALQKIAEEDQGVLQAVVFQLREKTEKLAKIGDAFSIINDFNA